MMVSPRYLRMRARRLAKKELPPVEGDCTDCGKPATVYDHRDYRRPLDVDSVCSTCNTIRGMGYPPTDGPDLEVDWITSRRKPVVKECRMEILMSKNERALLRELAERRGISQGDVLRGMIRRAAKRLK